MDCTNKTLHNLFNQCLSSQDWPSPVAAEKPHQEKHKPTLKQIRSFCFLSLFVIHFILYCWFAETHYQFDVSVNSPSDEEDPHHKYTFPLDLSLLMSNSEYHAVGQRSNIEEELQQVHFQVEVNFNILKQYNVVGLKNMRFGLIHFLN